MVFSSILFLGLFLPVTLFLYYLFPNRRIRNAVLLIASLVFYAWGEPVWVFAMVALAVLDYLAGLLLAAAGGAWKRVLLAVTIVMNLALLFLFKYYNFLSDSIASLLAMLQITIVPPSFPFGMPIGISFFTFQAITYVVDVSRGEVTPQKNPFRVLLYIALFPQLIAGPIVRYRDVEYEIGNRRETMQDFAEGAFRFAVGLGKKVIFANYAGKVASTLLTEQIGTLTADSAWIGALMFTLQIYFDFSGYSDMAIGLGRMFGFHFQENFNYPYMSRSVTEFWRRWHISLGSFFRDYVYIPLGGNRRHMWFNILLVWVLTGLWHGASWNFMLWGLYYAVLLICEKCLRRNGIEMGKLPFASNLLLLLITVFGWVIFYYTDFSQMLTCLRAMLGLGGIATEMTLMQLSSVSGIYYLIPAMVIGATPFPARLAKRLVGGRGLEPVLRTAWMLLMLAVCFTLIVYQTYNPFLYFRF